MPLYEYYCQQHGIFTKIVGIADRHQAVACPSCSEYASRMVSAPNLALMNSANRSAWARNEKSAHEPSLKRKHVCTHKHACDDRRGQSEFKRAGNGARPWMLGH